MAVGWVSSCGLSLPSDIGPYLQPWDGWKECILASVGASKSAKAWRKKALCDSSVAFHCPRTAPEGEMCAYSDSEPGLGAQPCKPRAQSPEACEEGSAPISPWKGRRWLCRWRALATLWTPMPAINSGGYPGQLQSSGSLPSATCVYA